MLYAPVIEADEYTVVLAPDMAGLFVHEAFGHLSEADSLDENERLKELLKVGTEYGPKDLDIFDSGVEGGNRGEAKYDDEGVPMQKTYLIKGGVVVGHLHCRESAWKMGEKPTGNARAISTVSADCANEDHLHRSAITSGRHAQGHLSGSVRGRRLQARPTAKCSPSASRCNMIRNGSIAEPYGDPHRNVFTTSRTST